jgi:hypothetical protein
MTVFSGSMPKHKHSAGGIPQEHPILLKKYSKATQKPRILLTMQDNYFFRFSCALMSFDHFSTV